MSSTTGNDHVIPQGADPGAVAHSSGSMGSRPSQAIFLGNLALALLGAMVVASAFVLAAAMVGG